MRRTIILAAGIGLLLPCAALAQNREEGLQVGDYAPTIEAEEWMNVPSEDEIPSLTDLRGNVVVLFFWVSWNEGGEMLLPWVNVLSYNDRIGKAGGVYTIGITDADRRATQPLIDDAKIFFPVAVGSTSAEEYGLENGVGFVVVGPDGKIIYKGSGRGDLNAAQNALATAIQESPPFKTHPSEAKLCLRDMNTLRDMIRDGKFPKAHRVLFDALDRAVLGDRLKSEFVEFNDLIERLGYDRMAEFKPLLEQRKYDEAAEVLRDVIKRFRGYDCYMDAKALYAEFREKDEHFKMAAERFDDEDAAARLYLEARDDLKSREFGDCYDKLTKVSTDYPKTEAAQYAEAMLARMKENASVWAIVRDHEASAPCRLMLAQARNLIGDGKYAEADQTLRKLLRDFPNTSWAEEAAEELKNLP